MYVYENDCMYMYELCLHACCACRCGKTTVCQLHAAAKQQPLHSVNCHLHTEASDFLGGLRPVRARSQPKTSPIVKRCGISK